MASEEDKDLDALRSAVLASINKKGVSDSSESVVPDDDDEDLEALRQAALLSRKSTKENEKSHSTRTLNPLQVKKYGFRRHNAWTSQRTAGNMFHRPFQRSNLIVINPVSTDQEASRSKTQSLPELVLPTEQWTSRAASHTTSMKQKSDNKYKASGRFSRFESNSDTDDSDYDLDLQDSNDSINESADQDQSSDTCDTHLSANATDTTTTLQSEQNEESNSGLNCPDTDKTKELPNESSCAEIKSNKEKSLSVDSSYDHMKSNEKPGSLDFHDTNSKMVPDSLKQVQDKRYLKLLSQDSKLEEKKCLPRVKKLEISNKKVHSVKDNGSASVHNFSKRDSEVSNGKPLVTAFAMDFRGISDSHKRYQILKSCADFSCSAGENERRISFKETRDSKDTQSPSACSEWDLRAELKRRKEEKQKKNGEAHDSPLHSIQEQSWKQNLNYRKAHNVSKSQTSIHSSKGNENKRKGWSWDSSESECSSSSNSSFSRSRSRSPQTKSLLSVVKPVNLNLDLSREKQESLSNKIRDNSNDNYRTQRHKTSCAWKTSHNSSNKSSLRGKNMLNLKTQRSPTKLNAETSEIAVTSAKQVSSNNKFSHNGVHSGESKDGKRLPVHMRLGVPSKHLDIQKDLTISVTQCSSKDTKVKCREGRKSSKSKKASREVTISYTKLDDSKAQKDTKDSVRKESSLKRISAKDSSDYRKRLRS